MDNTAALKRDVFCTRTRDESLQLGQSWSAWLRPGACMYFCGELGAGKTTLIQGIAQGLGIDEPALSPTFSIMETYRTPSGIEVMHLDLYRIENPGELLLIGLDEYRRDSYVWLIEWPQQGAGVVPDADFRITVQHAGEQRQITLESVADCVSSR